MHEEPLQMLHRYKYDLWGHNSSLCVLSDFYALSSVFDVAFAGSMSGLDSVFEDSLRQGGLWYVIQNKMIAIRPGDDSAAPEVPIVETLAP